MQVEVNFVDGLEFILSHFNEPLFPRTISTKSTQGRRLAIHNKGEALARFRQAKGYDCRIAAYPVYTYYYIKNTGISPDFLFIDLDLGHFDGSKPRLDRCLNKTLNNIQIKFNSENLQPTVIWSGNGYHIYLPVEAFVLEHENIFLTYIDSTECSKKFMQFAERFLSNDKADECHWKGVSFKNCMLRIPGSINSKNNKIVELIQLWDNNRPKANCMLFDFYIKLAAKKFAFRSKQKDYYYQNKSITKNYRHFGHTNSSPVKEIDWIEDLLEGSGLGECRQLFIDLVLAPYLVNVKKCDHESAYNSIVHWLDKCSRKRSLKFNVTYKVNYALNHSRKVGMKPMRLDTMKLDYVDMYKEVILKENGDS